jgi:hypothetical protein
MKFPVSPPCRVLFIRSNATNWRRRPYWAKGAVSPWLARLFWNQRCLWRIIVTSNIDCKFCSFYYPSRLLKFEVLQAQSESWLKNCKWNFKLVQSLKHNKQVSEIETWIKIYWVYSLNFALTMWSSRSILNPPPFGSKNTRNSFRHKVIASICDPLGFMGSTTGYHLTNPKASQF